MKKFSCVAFTGFLCCCLLLTACEHEQKVMLSGSSMGTLYHITYLAPANFTIKQEEVEEKIKTTLASVNHQMSSYDKNSVLSLLNRHKESNQPFEVPKNLANVIREAILINRLTQGGLDITIAPLVNLWGFGAKNFNLTVPDDASIIKALKQTGIDKISVLQSDGKYFIQKDPASNIDLASIAKGFGVDEVARVMESFNIKNFLVEIGGEIRVKGRNQQGELWRVGIEKPDTTGQRVVEKIVSITDMGMATSGDYRNYFKQDGKRFSHAIDPSTGWPIKHNLASITVLHPSTMTADGLATGLYVLGPKKAINIAEKENLAIYLILREKDGFKGMFSSAFARILEK